MNATPSHSYHPDSRSIPKKATLRYREPVNRRLQTAVLGMTHHRRTNLVNIRRPFPLSPTSPPQDRAPRDGSRAISPLPSHYYHYGSRQDGMTGPPVHSRVPGLLARSADKHGRKSSSCSRSVNQSKSPRSSGTTPIRRFRLDWLLGNVQAVNSDFPRVERQQTSRTAISTAWTYPLRRGPTSAGIPGRISRVTRSIAQQSLPVQFTTSRPWIISQVGPGKSLW